MTNEEEIALLEKVVANLWKPLIAGGCFPKEYIRNRKLIDSFDEICEEFYLLVRDKATKDKELFDFEKNALFDKLKKFFETYPKIAYIQKSWNLVENLLWRPTWVKQKFRTSILEATMWFEILRLKEFIERKQCQAENIYGEKDDDRNV